MLDCEFLLCDCLEKVMSMEKPDEMKVKKLYVFPSIGTSFNFVYKSNDTAVNGKKRLSLAVSAPGFDIRIRKVSLVADTLPTLAFDDPAYLFTQPSLVPDRLDEYRGFFKPLYGQYRALYINVDAASGAQKGSSFIELSVMDEDVCVYSNKIEVVLSEHEIRPLPIAHTEWIYVDCLSDYYQDEVYSEENWECIENNLAFIKKEAGVNMVYTPLFTPPLDTKPGLERTCCQLVGIKVRNGEYFFDFSNFDRWCSILRKYGFEYVEISHLFSQWGAKYAPCIYAEVEGRQKRIFGWQSESYDSGYIKFLSLLLPQVKERLHSFGFDDSHIYFHISDEPGIEGAGSEGDTAGRHLNSYQKAKDSVLPYIGECVVFDALSSYKLYAAGAVDLPVVSADHIDEFIQNKAPLLWVYYCIGQTRNVPNRFMSLPLYRTRVLGILMYYHDIKGFLHWGYNFYKTELSEADINPYSEMDAGEAFCPGDAYLVYPGRDRQPVSSLRVEANRQAFEDYMLLHELEEKKGRSYVLSLIQEYAGGVPSFASYPQNKGFILSLMARVCMEIA